MKYQKIVVLPDIHVPNHEESAIRPILDFMKFYKPDILIQLGDFCDWDSVSGYDLRREEDLVTLEHEIKESNYLLDDIDKFAKGAKKIMLGGNHEARLAKLVASDRYSNQVKKIRNIGRWDQEYNLHKRGWKSYDYGEHVIIGKCVFTHGWYASGGAAKAMAECFPGRNVIFGHTHQHLIYGCMDEHNYPIESESIGTLSRFDLSYLNGKPAKNWVHSFMYIDMLENGMFTKHFTRVIDGSFIEYGRQFKASARGI